MAFRIIPNVPLAGRQYTVTADVDGILMQVIGVYDTTNGGLVELSSDEVAALGMPLVDFCWLVLEGTGGT